MEISYDAASQYVLEEEYDEDYDPTEEEVLEYCKVIGLDPVAEQDLLHIAKEGIKAPLPNNWKPIEDAAGSIYYFDFTNGESMWEHPCDEYYRKLLRREREKRKELGKGVERKGRAQTGGVTVGKSTGSAKRGIVSTQGKPTLPPPLGVPALRQSGGGLGGVGFPSLGGLPPLKAPTRAGALAPLRMPTATSQSGSGLGGSLTSTGGSTLRSSGLVGGRGHTLGTIDLGTAAISTHFEEEDEEEEDSDSDLVRGFKSKLGLNVLGAEDLGFKEESEEEEEEEGDGDSSDDVSQELRRVLELDQSEGGEEGESEGREGAGMDTPDRPNNPAMPAPVLSVDEAPSQPSHPGRPGAARGSRPPPLQSAVQPGALRGVASTPARPPEGVALHPALTVAAITSTAGGRNPEMDQKDAGRLHSSHARDLEQQRQRLAEELEAAQQSLREEHEAKVASLRRELASELVEEEKRMRAKRETTLEALRAKLCEEEEEEEARLHEAKEDRLRRLQQQLSQEREKEERKLREAKEKAVEDLHTQLKDKQTEEESRLRSSAEGELGELRSRLTAELEEERGGAKIAHEKELGELQQQLREEHRKALQELRSTLERELNQEEERQRAEEALQAELAAALEARRTQLQEQHRSQLGALEQQMAGELESLREEGRTKVDKERGRLEEELEETAATIEKEHKARLEQLSEKCSVSQRQYEEQREKQARELAALQVEHEQRKAEVGQLQDSLEQQRLEVEGVRRRLTEEEEELRAQEERLQALRSASTQESEQLLQRQQGELQAAMEAERKNLKSLRRSRSSLEEELRSLQEQVEQERRQLAQLQREKGSLKASRSTTSGKVVLKNTAVQTPVNPALPTVAPAPAIVDDSAPQAAVQSSAHFPPSPSPPHATSGLLPVTHTMDRPSPGGERVINMNPSRRERVKFEGSPDPGEESDQSLTSTTSMRLEELTTHPEKRKPTTPPSPETEAGVSELEGARPQQEQHQRSEGTRPQQEQHQRLRLDQTSLSQTRSELRRQQRARKSQRVALKQADRQTPRQRSYNHKYRNQHELENSQQGLMRDVQSKLEQEGMALSELEQRMRFSHQQLDLREQRMRELQASLHSDGHSSDQDSEPPPDPHTLHLGDLPSPQTYLARLRERLEQSQKTTSRHARGSLAAVAVKPLKLQLSDGSTVSSGDSTSDLSETETEDVLHQKPASGPSKPHFSTATRELLKGGGRAGGSQGEIMSSLSKINGQLGELLTKLNQPPPAYPHTGLLQDQDVPPTISLSGGSQRWADPVRHPDRTDLALQRKRAAYIGGHYHAVPESLAADVTPPSPPRWAEQGLRYQTDWLKEFQRSVPLSSRLGGPALAHGTPSGGPRTSQYRPRPRLTLDSSNNVRLVQV